MILMDPNGPKGLKNVKNAQAFLVYDYCHTENRFSFQFAAPAFSLAKCWRWNPPSTVFVWLQRQWNLNPS